ncbi:MAG: sigma-70 family RNA polymerase sigma factor [Ruminococcus sp.]
MSRRVSLPDFLGKEDSDINALFSDETDENNRFATVKRILLKVIENELTERQKQIINLYYFKNMNMVSIADMLGISPASVSVTLKRARNTIIKYMKYYF